MLIVYMIGWIIGTILMCIRYYFEENQEQDAGKYLALQVLFMLLYILTVIMVQNGFRTKKPLWLWPFIVVTVSLF
jgi:hypothetical protein